MTYPGQQASLLDDGSFLVRTRILCTTQQLEGNLTVQLRVAGPEDFTERALSHLLQNYEAPPSIEDGLSLAGSLGSQRLVPALVCLGDVGDLAEGADQPLRILVACFL